MSTSVLTPAATHFMVDSAALLKTAQLATLLVTRNPVIPVLDHLLLRVDKAASKQGQRNLRICSSDLEHYFTSKAVPIECVSTPDQTAMCVPAKQLTDLLRGIGTQPLTLRIDTAEAAAPVLHLQAALPHSLLPSGTGSAQYQLCGESDVDFPRNVALGLTEAIVYVPGHLLLAGLAMTMPVIATDELRPAMCGVYLTITKSMFRMVASDGHRLVRYTKEDQHTLDGPVVEGIIPRRAAEMLTKLVSRHEKVELVRLGDSLSVKMKAGELRIRLIDERYPDYEQVLPTNQPNVLVAHRSELLAGVKRCALFANKTNRQLVFKLSAERCELLAEDLEFHHRAAESVPGTYVGESMSIGLNSGFISGFLLALPAQNVKMCMSTPNRAVTLQSADAEDGLLMLMMPVMLNNY